jgi:multidrug efflux system membrane fusion protein
MTPGEAFASRRWLVAGLLLLVVALWLLSGSLTRSSKSATPASPPPKEAAGRQRVQVHAQEAQSVTRFISIYGRTAPARVVELKAETEGRVATLGVARGRQLHKGDIILKLDLRDREARLAQAKATVSQQQTAYGGQLELKKKGYVSDTQLAETLAKLEGARTELLRAELDLKYMTIRAPFDGVLEDRQVEQGDFVRPGEKVATVADNTRLIVTGSLAEQDARNVARESEATAKLVTGEHLKGRVRYISPVAAESTRTFTIELELPNPDGAIPAGVTAEMQIPGGEVRAHKISPALLSLAADGQVGVKTVDAANRVVFTPVGISRSDPDGIWVTGLPQNANIIVVGQAYVSAGQAVQTTPSMQETTLAGGQLENLK